MEINRAGVFGPFLLDFGAISKIISEIYIRVEINRAGIFGPFLLDFGAISKIISEIYICVEINRAGAFGPFFVGIWGNLNIMSLAASLSSALELQNIEFVK